MKPLSVMQYRGSGVAPNPDLPWTALQLHFDELVSGAWVDSSPSPKSVTRWGASSVSGPEAHFGAGSMNCTAGALDGQGAYIDSAGIVVGTADYSYDFWIKVGATSPESIIWDTRRTTNGTGGMFMDIHPSLGLVIVSGGVSRYNGTNVTTGVMNHIEVSRTGSGSNNSFLFLNGIQLANWTDNTNYTSTELFIGGGTYSPLGVLGPVGYIDEFRLLIGKGGHTSNFTPPTAAYGDA